MKKKILIGLVLISILVGMSIYVDKTSIDYNLECSLKSVKNNTITVEDKEGNLWQYESEDIPGGFDTIYLNMNDNNTEEIEDDKIITVIRR